MEIQSIRCALPCCTRAEEEQTKCSLNTRITVVGLGGIALLVGILVLSGISGLSELGAMGGAALTAIGGLILLTGLCLRCVKGNGKAEPTQRGNQGNDLNNGDVKRTKRKNDAKLGAAFKKSTIKIKDNKVETINGGPGIQKEAKQKLSAKNPQYQELKQQSHMEATQRGNQGNDLNSGDLKRTKQESNAKLGAAFKKSTKDNKVETINGGPGIQKAEEEARLKEKEEVKQKLSEYQADFAKLKQQFHNLKECLKDPKECLKNPVDQNPVDQNLVDQYYNNKSQIQILEGMKALQTLDKATLKNLVNRRKFRDKIVLKIQRFSNAFIREELHNFKNDRLINDYYVPLQSKLKMEAGKIYRIYRSILDGLDAFENKLSNVFYGKLSKDVLTSQDKLTYDFKEIDKLEFPELPTFDQDLIKH